MQRDGETVLDMLLAAEAISEFVHGVNREQFSANREKQSAVLHQLMILGEACKRLSPEFRQAHIEVPWSRIAGMRDRLIHAYDDVDVSLVWDSITNELPPVVEQLRRLAPSP